MSASPYPHPHQNLVNARVLAGRIAFQADGREPEGFSRLISEAKEMVLDIDPDRVDRSSPEYVSGVFDALAAMLYALQEHSLSAETINLLAKPGRAHVLLAAAFKPRQTCRELAQNVGLSEVEAMAMVAELTEGGLFDPSPMRLEGRTYHLTPWGHKAAGWVTQNLEKFGDLELRVFPRGQ